MEWPGSRLKKVPKTDAPTGSRQRAARRSAGTISMRLNQKSFTVAIATFIGATTACSIFAVDSRGLKEFRKDIRPLLENYCYDCHADGAKKGNIAFDDFKTDQAALEDRELWGHVLKNLRAGLMPPQKKSQPTTGEKAVIEQWIKRAVFAGDPSNPDPGRVTLRRLNREEYHNTIRDLIGVQFDSQKMFPPDDTGYGFDNIGDVLTLPPMLLEKYVMAAHQIIEQAVPTTKITDQPAQEQARRSKQYAQFFPKPVPAETEARRTYARELLSQFARRAFRRPADTATLDRLTNLAESVYSQPGKTFETGVAQAMVAVLASPRFLFREEQLLKPASRRGYPLLDELSLASRLSYFLWSSMPDEELLRLAEAGKLRKNLAAQVERMLQDDKSEAFVRNFVGQWLRARDIESIPIEAAFVLAREEKPDAQNTQKSKRTNEPKTRSENQRSTELTPELRRAMRLETEKAFDYVLRNDRSLLELLDADYAFLNERLATHYGIPNVTGAELRLVKLPPDSPRGGILTQGTMLGVTSNPTRTSPVKRGVFVLENILGTPPPPPPPNIPPLEDAAKGLTNHPPTLRESLAAHRENALCASCHNRMDPLGLAFENFNAMGMWRETEFNEPIDATGRLITGEPFANVRELKQILVQNHSQDFYRTLTEKMLIYALGRGLEYYDVETCDQIEARLMAANGRPSALIAGVVESAAFQKMRAPNQNK